METFRGKACFGACLVGWLCFSPVTSRVSPRQPSYFFSAKPKKSNQKKGEPRPCRFAVPCATRKMEHPRSGFAASPSRGRHQRPGKAVSVVPLVGAALRELRPNGLFAALTSQGWGYLIPLPSLLTRARHAVPLHLSPLIPHLWPWATTRVAPTTSRLTPHSSLLRPHSSLLRPHSSLLRPHSSHLIPLSPAP